MPVIIDKLFSNCGRSLDEETRSCSN